MVATGGRRVDRALLVLRLRASRRRGPRVARRARRRRHQNRLQRRRVGERDALVSARPRQRARHALRRTRRRRADAGGGAVDGGRQRHALRNRARQMRRTTCRNGEEINYVLRRGRCACTVCTLHSSVQYSTSKQIATLDKRAECPRLCMILPRYVPSRLHLVNRNYLSKIPGKMRTNKKF